MAAFHLALLWCLIFSLVGITVSAYNAVNNLAATIPVIDVGALMAASDVSNSAAESAHSSSSSSFCASINSLSDTIKTASMTAGFFYIKNHGVPEELVQELREISAAFFALPLEEKQKIAMIYGGKAWRGFFAVGDEMTSGQPDEKEGIYFGTEPAPGTAESEARPLHGRNLWPTGKLGERMQTAVLKYLSLMKRIGQRLMSAVACSLIADPKKHDIFLQKFSVPTELFRIFSYPPHSNQYGNSSMGVGEHTDYGYLTILYQDPSGGLQVRDLQGDWQSAPFIPGTFVVNLGDALEHNTQGLLRATPHRVVQRTGTDKPRLSMPYFFDPNFDSLLQPIVPLMSDEDKNAVKAVKLNSARVARWDKQDPTVFEGKYGDYLMNKVSKVFPVLFEQQQLNELLIDSAGAAPPRQKAEMY